MTAECDGAIVLRALEAAEARLARQVDEVNRLNVYPVPDGDTGTNMLHTMRSAVGYARKVEETGAGAVMAAAARGALMGARGNSGVILSQILAGAKTAFGSKELVGGEELVEAFQHGRQLAYGAISKPVEGTILTAISAMAEALLDGPGEKEGALLDAAVAAGREATRRTPELLPVLKRAGVVDAGALGLVYVIEGIADLANGRDVPLASDEHADVSVAPAPAAATGERSWGYDVQYLLLAPTRDVADLRAEMERFGLEDPSLSCVLVVGDETAVKVHVHTERPDEILRVGLSAGPLRDIVVENLDAMALEQEGRTGVSVTQADIEVRPLAAVAVVPGPGLARIFRGIGGHPLDGGPTRNPSVEELLDAIARAPGESVLLLPNDKNVLMAAERAAAEAAKPTRVVPTRNVSQGYAALLALEEHGDLAAVAEKMAGRAAEARSLEVTRASRDASLDDTAVREGQYMALLDGRCVAVAATAEDALEAGARAAGAAEIASIYVGADVEEARSREAAGRLRAVLGCEVEVEDGGQPHYPYIVSLE